MVDRKTQENKALYDKIRLLMMNNQAFEAGLIDGELKEKIEQRIWAS